MKLAAISLAILSVLLIASSEAKPLDLNPCAACEFFTGALIGQLGADRNPQHISAKLDTFCNNMPVFVKPDCQRWVTQYKPAIISAIQTGATASTTCRNLRVCSSLTQNIAWEEFAAFDNSTTECDVCTFITTEVIAQLNNNDTQANIVATLHWICEFLPLGQQMCKDFISANLPELIKYLSEGDSAAQICKLIGYCQSEQQVDINALRVRLAAFLHVRSNNFQPQDHSRKCELCQYIETTAEEMIKSGNTLTQVAKHLPSMCSFLGPYEDECHNAVGAYGRKLIGAMQESEDACVAIAMCKA